MEGMAFDSDNTEVLLGKGQILAATTASARMNPFTSESFPGIRT